MLLYAPSLSAIATIFTIGHSTHGLGAFLALLRGAGIEAVADVRRYPSSRRMPWFNSSALAESLADGGVEYHHFAELGGRHSPLPDSPNGAWRVGQFRGYADHMATSDFENGLARLLALTGRRRTALMCAEARWTSCHRRLIADALVARAHEVIHVGSRGALERHQLTEFAQVAEGRVTYPPEQQSLAL